MKKALVLMVASLWIGEVRSQYFHHVYGDKQLQTANGSCITKMAKGFCITGMDNRPNSSPGINISHPDALGNSNLTTNFNEFFQVYDALGNAAVAEGKAVTEYNDNGKPGYAIVGTLTAGNFSGLFFMKLNQFGLVTTFIPVNYPGFINATPRSIIYNVLNNKFVFVGKIEPSNGDPIDIFITEVDGFNFFATQVLDIQPDPLCPLHASSDDAYDVVQDPYSGDVNSYYVVGKCNDVDGVVFGYMLNANTVNIASSALTLYPIGNLLQGTNKDVEFYSIDAVPAQNSFIIGGKYRDGDDNFAVVHVKPDGTIKWSSFFDYTPDITQDNACVDVRADATGSTFYAIGNVAKGFYGKEDIELVILDVTGKGMGEVTYGGALDDNAVGIEILNGLNILGGTSSNGNGPEHYFIHTDYNGQSDPYLNGFCKNSNRKVTQLYPNMTWYSPGHGPVAFNVSADYNFTLVKGTYADREICKSVVISVPNTKSSTTGINASELNAGFVAYPNPFNDKLMIQPDKDNGGEIKSIYVINALGQLVDLKIENEAGVLSINTGDWRKGMYTVKILDTNGATHIYKVIK